MTHTRSFDQVAARLRAECPHLRLLALGQTVYWDEPMKAILRRLLDEQLPDARMVIGIHDADYFSKIPSNCNIPDDWAILPHNDGGTKDLWVATGEISRLFGSETIPTRDLLTAHGVQLDKIARDFPGGRDALIDRATQAWGWRGIVHVDSGHEISCEVTLPDALPHLEELLEWGFSRSLDTLTEPDAERGRRIADELRAEAREFAEANPDASLTDMLCDFLVRFYTRLLGYTSQNVELSTASNLFTFNRSTAGLPRFRPLRLFMDPYTRDACREAYNLAVQDSDIYSLDRFPPGALPFDLVVCGRGRGTICIRDGEVVIDLDEAISIPIDTPPANPEELAALIEDHLGTDVSLIGKALTLVLMIASEYVFVLHEEASAYVPLCEKMVGRMKERGINIHCCPILRIKYQTWDSLDACDTTFRLPGHLAAAFRQGEMTSREFADSWRTTVTEQESILERIARLTNLDDLLAFLAEQQMEPWRTRINSYMDAYAIVRSISERTEPLKEESIRLRDLSHQIKQETQELEAEKGEHFRMKVKPLRDRLDMLEAEGNTSGEEAEKLRGELAEHLRDREEYEHRIEQKRDEAQQARNRSLELKQEVTTQERGDEARNARETLKRIEYEAELARLWLVRDAILVSKGLTYTNHRPSAWWLMLVDPELRWFNRIAETAEFRFEELCPEQPNVG